MVPLKIWGSIVNGICASTQIWEYWRIESSGKVIEKSPASTLPSGWVSVPESRTISGLA